MVEDMVEDTSRCPTFFPESSASRGTTDLVVVALSSSQRTPSSGTANLVAVMMGPAIGVEVGPDHP
jgi:hypothetical protein